jgi:hypothetical protein
VVSRNLLSLSSPIQIFEAAGTRLHDITSQKTLHTQCYESVQYHMDICFQLVCTSYNSEQFLGVLRATPFHSVVFMS